MWMSGAGWSAVLVLALLAAAGLLVYLLSSKKKKARIKIGEKEKVIFNVGGTRNCPACRTKLEAGQPRARCQVDPRHEIHAECSELVRGKCPMCNGKLI